MGAEDILKEQLAWHKKASQGCVFAATLAVEDRSEDSGIFRLVIGKEINSDLIKEIALLIGEKSKEESITLLSVIIPNINSLSNLQQFLALIKECTDWSVDDSEIYQGFHIVKVRIPLGQNDEDGSPIFAWALFFGNFKFFPPTRQSPYFEFVLSVKTRQFLKEKYDRMSLTQQNEDTMNRGGSSTDAHLADVFINDITNVGLRDKRMWKNTRLRKEEVLTYKGTIPYDDTRAKAKVTCSYPIETK